MSTVHIPLEGFLRTTPPSPRLTPGRTPSPAYSHSSALDEIDIATLPSLQRSPRRRVPALSSSPALSLHELAVPVSRIAPPLSAIIQPPHDDGPGRTPSSPMGIQDMRYTNRHLMSYSDEQIIRVAPMRMSYQRQSLALGWTACRHPEGQLYFRNIEQRTWTNVWLYDTHNLEAVNNFTMQLRFDIEQQNDLPSDTEAVVHIQEFEDGTMEQSYYLVSASIRTIFWLEEVDVSLLTLGMVPVYENSHLESAQQMQYWIHVEMFPDDFAIHTELLDEVVDFLLWQSFDARTSETSTAPMSPEELDQLLRGVKEVRVGKHSGSVCVVARICHFSYRERFTNFYGEKAARLERHRSIFKEPFWSQPGRSWFFLVVSPMLLYLPDQYLEQIEKVWIDGKVVHRPWSTFITGLQRDWESSMTPSTVLLTANVGFLAIQSVDSSTSFRSAAQIASYISTLCSVGSLLLCTILSRQHRNNAHGTAAEAVQYLARRSQTIGGLQLLAITFSLPGALFSWGMLGFYISVCWVCFHETRQDTVITTAIVLVIVTSMLAGVVYMDWTPTEQTLRRRLKSYLVESLLGNFNFGKRSQIHWTFRKFVRKNSDAESEVTAV